MRSFSSVTWFITSSFDEKETLQHDVKKDLAVPVKVIHLCNTSESYKKFKEKSSRDNKDVIVWRDHNELCMLPSTHTAFSSSCFIQDIVRSIQVGRETVTFTNAELQKVKSMGFAKEIRSLGFPHGGYLVHMNGLFRFHIERFGGATVMMKEGVASLCCIRLRENSEPKLAALVPQRCDESDDMPSGFHLVFLPFKDNIRILLSNDDACGLAYSLLQAKFQITHKSGTTEANEEEVEEALNHIKPAMGGDKFVGIVERLRKYAGETLVEGVQGRAKRPKTVMPIEGEEKSDVSELDLATNFSLCLTLHQHDLESLNVNELKEQCKKAGISYSGKRKADLIKALKDRRAGV
eukprot:761937-Hanusia_phi.AAC.6